MSPACPPLTPLPCRTTLHPVPQGCALHGSIRHRHTHTHSSSEKRTLITLASSLSTTSLSSYLSLFLSLRWTADEHTWRAACVPHRGGCRMHPPASPRTGDLPGSLKASRGLRYEAHHDPSSPSRTSLSRPGPQGRLGEGHRGRTPWRSSSSCGGMCRRGGRAGVRPVHDP